VLGSSDLIGNPVGLIDKLGKGVYQLISEPAKGLLKSPQEFVKGIGKGVGGLFSSVVTGSFGSISKITGSLYGVVRTVGGDDQGTERIKDSSNVVTGIYQGVWGGAKDIYEGITGIVTKPYNSAQKEGVKGFFKGLGSGALGVITSPFSALLHLGTSVTSGIVSTANLLDRSKVALLGRSRFPRQFSSTMVVQKYNPEIAQAQDLLRNNIKNKKELLIVYQKFKDLNNVIALITTERILIFIEGEKRSEMKLKNIKHCGFKKQGDKISLELKAKVATIDISSCILSGLLKVWETVSALNNKIDQKEGYQSLVDMKKEPKEVAIQDK